MRICLTCDQTQHTPVKDTALAQQGLATEWMEKYLPCFRTLSGPHRPHAEKLVQSAPWSAYFEDSKPHLCSRTLLPPFGISAGPAPVSSTQHNSFCTFQNTILQYLLQSANPFFFRFDRLPAPEQDETTELFANLASPQIRTWRTASWGCLCCTPPRSYCPSPES